MKIFGANLRYRKRDARDNIEIIEKFNLQFLKRFLVNMIKEVLEKETLVQPLTETTGFVSSFFRKGSILKVIQVKTQPSEFFAGFYILFYKKFKYKSRNSGKKNYLRSKGSGFQLFLSGHAAVEKSLSFYDGAPIRVPPSGLGIDITITIAPTHAQRNKLKHLGLFYCFAKAPI